MHRRPLQQDRPAAVAKPTAQTELEEPTTASSEPEQGEHPVTEGQTENNHSRDTAVPDIKTS